MHIFGLFSKNIQRFSPKSYRSLFRNMLNLLIIISRANFNKKLHEEIKFQELFSNENVINIKKNLKFF